MKSPFEHPLLRAEGNEKKQIDSIKKKMSVSILRIFLKNNMINCSVKRCMVEKKLLKLHK